MSFKRNSIALNVLTLISNKFKRGLFTELSHRAYARPFGFCSMEEADFRCSQACYGEPFPELKITAQSNSEHRQRNFDILVRCRNTRCRRCAVVGVAFQKVGAPPLPSTLSALSSPELVRLHVSKQHNTVGVPSPDLKIYRNMSNSLIPSRIERVYTGLLFLSFNRFFFLVSGLSSIKLKPVIPSSPDVYLPSWCQVVTSTST